LKDKGRHLRKMLSLCRKKDGVSAVEYALMVGLITLAIAVAVNSVGKNLSSNFTTAAQAVETQTGTGTGAGEAGKGGKNSGFRSL
jgi:Flp pilus assembly pilin Flp